MEICKVLDIPKGITAIVGAGGKTTLLGVLGQELKSYGKTVLCTTTHFQEQNCNMLISPSVEEVREAFKSTNLIAVASLTNEERKYGAVEYLMNDLINEADYIIAEADGARCHPLKAPESWEPVIPDKCNLVIAVAGIDGCGMRVCDSAHRPNLYADIIGKNTSDIVTPYDIARVLVSDRGQKKNVKCRYEIVINKADIDGKRHMAFQCKNLIKNEKVIITSLRDKRIYTDEGM